MKESRNRTASYALAFALLGLQMLVSASSEVDSPTQERELNAVDNFIIWVATHPQDALVYFAMFTMPLFFLAAYCAYILLKDIEKGEKVVRFYFHAMSKQVLLSEKGAEIEEDACEESC